MNVNSFKVFSPDAAIDFSDGLKKFIGQYVRIGLIHASITTILNIASLRKQIRFTIRATNIRIRNAGNVNDRIDQTTDSLGLTVPPHADATKPAAMTIFAIAMTNLAIFPNQCFALMFMTGGFEGWN